MRLLQFAKRHDMCIVSVVISENSSSRPGQYCQLRSDCAEDKKRDSFVRDVVLLPTRTNANEDDATMTCIQEVKALVRTPCRMLLGSACCRGSKSTALTGTP